MSEELRDLTDYVKNSMIDQKSPAEEVLVVDDTVCVRVKGTLFGIKIKQVKVKIDNEKKKSTT